MVVEVVQVIRTISEYFSNASLYFSGNFCSASLAHARTAGSKAIIKFEKVPQLAEPFAFKISSIFQSSIEIVPNLLTIRYIANQQEIGRLKHWDLRGYGSFLIGTRLSPW